MLTVFFIRVAITQVLAIAVFGRLESVPRTAGPDPAKRRHSILAASICTFFIVVIITLMELACDYPGH